MNLPKVSVIIPVYNTELYLETALESITRQSLEELEIIIVNDGSTDNSADIIEKFAISDKRIKVISQNNQGLSCARNAGLKLAKGEYIYFMDSDDILQQDTLEQCYKFCCDKNLDFICFDADVILDGLTESPVQNYSRKGCIDTDKIWNGIDLLEYEVEHFLYKSPVWLYFVNRHFLTTFFNGFYPHIIHEDHLFTIPLHLYAHKACYMPQMFFKRRIREKSIMSSRFSMKNIDGYAVTIQSLLELSAEHNEWKDVIERVLKKMINAIIWEGHRLSWRDKCITFGLFLKNGWIRYAKIRTLIVFFLKGCTGKRK